MSDKVPPPETTDQPDHFAAIAAELYRIGDDIASLTGSGLPNPNQFQISIQPGTRGNDALTEAAIDAWATALFDRRGKVQPYSGGVFHYGTEWIARGPVTAGVYMSVSAEFAVKREAAAKLAEREAELENLRAEVAELRAALPAAALAGDTGLAYSRDADDPTPVSPARVEPHFGAMTDGGLVDETAVPAPLAEHYETGGWKGAGPGTAGVDCACGVAFDGFDSLDEAAELLRRHIVDAAHKDALDEDSERRLLAAADTVPVPAEDGTLTPLPGSAGSAERMAALQRAKESFA